MELTLKNIKADHCFPLETVAHTSSNEKVDIRHVFMEIIYVKRPGGSPEFWLTEVKTCGDPGCFTGPPHAWLRRVLPRVTSTWGTKSPLHRDTQIYLYIVTLKSSLN